MKIHKQTAFQGQHHSFHSVTTNVSKSLKKKEVRGGGEKKKAAERKGEIITLQ